MKTQQLYFFDYHTNLSRKRSFSKTLLNPKEFENASVALRFNVDEKHFDDITIVVISLNTNLRWPVIYCVFKFLRRSADESLKKISSESKVCHTANCYLLLLNHPNGRCFSVSQNHF